MVWLNHHTIYVEESYWIMAFCVASTLPEMDLLTFIRTADLTKVRIGERQRGEDEPKLLDTTVGRVVSLLPVALARGESELKDSVDRLFDEEGNDGPAEQGDSATGGQGVGIQPVSEAAETNIEDVVLRRQEKTSVAGKSMSVIQRLLVRAVQNVAVRGEPIPSLPFITSYVSTTPECEDERHTDTLAGANLQIVTAPQRSSAPAMTTATTVTVTDGAATVVKETVTKPSLFATGSSSVGGTKPIPDVYVPRWNVTNGSRLDDNRDFCEMGDDFAPPKFFASVCGIEHDQLFAEFNVGVARQMILSVERESKARSTLISALPDEHMNISEAIGRLSLHNPPHTERYAKDAELRENSLKIKPEQEEDHPVHLQNKPAVHGPHTAVDSPSCTFHLHKTSSSETLYKSCQGMFDAMFVYSLLADHEKDQQLCFDDLDQLNKQGLEAYEGSAEECVPAEVVISADDVVDSAEAVDSADCVVVSAEGFVFADCSVSAGDA
ncbi:hypothetical protein Tco_0059832 [Tanacetum coccineum]